jgi:ureidoglycolate hydrolase
MKFNVSLAATSTDLHGLADYEAAISDGRLRPVRRTLTHDRHGDGWQVMAIEDDVEYMRAADGDEPLEVGGMRIELRALVVDELTRHQATEQLFIPVSGPFVVPVAVSSPGQDEPDPESLTMIVVRPGEIFCVGRGTWHTLPFTLTEPVQGLSVMRREDLVSYHDVRDLTVAGWVGMLYWQD